MPPLCTVYASGAKKITLFFEEPFIKTWSRLRLSIHKMLNNNLPELPQTVRCYISLLDVVGSIIHFLPDLIRVIYLLPLQKLKRCSSIYKRSIISLCANRLVHPPLYELVSKNNHMTGASRQNSHRVIYKYK